MALSGSFSVSQRNGYETVRCDWTGTQSIALNDPPKIVHRSTGHGASYWKDRTIGGISDGLATEAFAEMTDSTFANPESLELIKKYLPKSYKVYEEMLEVILNG